MYSAADISSRGCLSFFDLLCQVICLYRFSVLYACNTYNGNKNEVHTCDFFFFKIVCIIELLVHFNDKSFDIQISKSQMCQTLEEL